MPSEQEPVEDNREPNGKLCKSCGAPLVGTQRTKCDPCKRERIRNYHREWEHRNPDKLTKPKNRIPRTHCKDCGEERDGSDPTYCKKCRNARNYASVKKRQAENPCRDCGGVIDGSDAYRCVACYRKYHTAWREANREKLTRSNRNRSLRQKYGITLDDFDALWESQQGACAICSEQMVMPDSRESKGADRKLWAHVDHDHATGAVRGLLCNNCNTGLGMFSDDPRILLKAISYLELWGYC